MAVLCDRFHAAWHLHADAVLTVPLGLAVLCPAVPSSPWGFGIRACIGSQFALWESKLFLAVILRCFRCVVTRVIVFLPGRKAKEQQEKGERAHSAWV